MERAYSTFEMKDFDDDKRTLTGIASTPVPDRMGDIVESKGAVVKLPLSFLWQHNSSKPVGHVTAAKFNSDGIPVTVQLVKPFDGAPQGWADRLNEAWADLKTGLVRGLSIGFRALERAQIEDTWSYRFTKWEWLELSAVTIPANAEATIQTIKAMDSACRRGGPVSLLRPPVEKDAPLPGGAIRLISP